MKAHFINKPPRVPSFSASMVPPTSSKFREFVRICSDGILSACKVQLVKCEDSLISIVYIHKTKFCASTGSMHLFIFLYFL